MSVFIPSANVVRETRRMNNLSAQELVQEYVSLPLLPVGVNIQIDCITVWFWDSIKRKSLPRVSYGLFTAKNPDEFPVARDVRYEYAADEQISPVIIKDVDGHKYRVPQLLWFPLIDIYDAIIRKQGKTFKRVLPCSVFIDNLQSNNPMQWMAQLANHVGYKYIKDLPPSN